jgi:hypothetical protein
MSPLLTTASTVICPHGGMAVLTTRNSQALVLGAPVLLQNELHSVMGCAFAPGGVPTPCLTVQWLTGGTQSAIGGVPALLQSSVGLCLNAAQAPQGTAIVLQAQTQAMGV